MLTVIDDRDYEETAQTVDAEETDEDNVKNKDPGKGIISIAQP